MNRAFFEQNKELEKTAGDYGIGLSGIGLGSF